MVDFVEQANNSARTIEELLVEFVPQVFKRYFQIFLLKANQQFVDISRTTYISSNPTVFITYRQSRAIFNKRPIYTENVNKWQLYAANQHISLSIQIKVEG